MAQQVGIWHCHYCGSGCCCGTGSIHGPRTSVCCRNGKKKKKKKKKGLLMRKRKTEVGEMIILIPE